MKYYEITVTEPTTFDGGTEYHIIRNGYQVPVIHFSDGRKGQTFEEALEILKSKTK